DGLAAEIMNDDLGVGRLAGVGVTETSAVADDGPAQAGDAQTPAANIRRVNIVVPQLAVARVPEPVPVVMKLRPRQLIHRRGTGPRFVIGNHAQILACLWLGTFLRDQVSGDLGGAIAIRIADVSDLTIRKPGEFARVLFAANAAADDGHCDFVVGAYGAFFGSGDRRGNRRGSSG